MELTNRDTLEADFARKISRLTNKKRKELEQLLGNPPDVTKVPPQFWADAERELNNEMILLLILIAASSYTQHGGELVPPSAVSPFDRAFEQSLGLSIDEPLPPEPIIRWAAENSGNVASEWSKHSQDILNSAQKDWTQTTIETGEHPTKGEIRDVTLRIFGPGRASRISVNETTRSQHFGSEHAIAMTVGLSPDDIWKTSEDDRVCPICSPLDNQPRSYWWRFFPDGPPDPHPLCRCYILYKHQPAEAVVESKLISESWDDYLHPRDDRGRKSRPCR
jgi:hypothetical protein